MIITIGKPCAITEKGGRSNNEDSIYPLPEQVTLDQKLFMVCDGVGGAEKGEVASSLACESIQTFFSTFLKDDPTPEFIHKAVHYAEVCFDSYVQEHPEAMGMATTLTMAYIASSGIVLAHIGDSRIYHLRKGEILYQTEDHSFPRASDGRGCRAQGEETLGAEIVYPGYAVRQTHRDGRERLGLHRGDLSGLLHLLIGVL